MTCTLCTLLDETKATNGYAQYLNRRQRNRNNTLAFNGTSPAFRRVGQTNNNGNATPSFVCVSAAYNVIRVNSHSTCQKPVIVKNISTSLTIGRVFQSLAVQWHLIRRGAVGGARAKVSPETHGTGVRKREKIFFFFTLFARSPIAA